MTSEKVETRECVYKVPTGCDTLTVDDPLGRGYRQAFPLRNGRPNSITVFNAAPRGVNVIWTDNVTPELEDFRFCRDRLEAQPHKREAVCSFL